MISIIGTAAPLPRDDVDTDAIIPSRAIRKPTADGLAAGLFAGWRYLDGEREEDPAFILNRPAYRAASILVAGANFGCGSSREAAVWALREFGIRCVIARSFGEVFHANCVHNGLLPATMTCEEHTALMREVAGENGSGGATTVDLAGLRIVSPSGTTYSFILDSLSRMLLLRGWSARDVGLAHLKAVHAFRARDREARPWLYDQGEDT
jgi:3-isopropylmalate/(R)-2-methylmalate dehydratase small subunit